MNRRKQPLWRGVDEPVPSVVEGTPAAPVLPTLFWPFVPDNLAVPPPLWGT
jgi:hypothetical protein